MAAIIANTQVNDLNYLSGGFTFTGLTTSDQYFEMGGKDHKSVILIQGLAAGTVTIECGDSPRAAAEPLTLTVAADKFYFLTIDSGYYANYSQEASATVAGHFEQGEKVATVAIKANAASKANVALIEVV